MGTKTHPLPADRFYPYLQQLAAVTEGPDLPYAACCAFLIGTGARIGEALTVREQDLFNPDGTPKERVTRNIEKKRGQPVRLTVSFPWQHIGQPITAWRDWGCRHRAKQPDELLFGQRWDGSGYSRYSIYRGNRRLLDRLGIPWRGVGLHGLRKTILRRILQDQIGQGKSWLEAMRYCQQYACHKRLETTIAYLLDDLPTDNPAMIGRIFAAQKLQ